MVSLTPIATLSKQVPASAFCRIAAMEIARRLLDKYRIYSFAQCGEDLTIDAMLGHKSLGMYVDVGCNHPVRASNTYRLYLRGWTGIAIDGNSAFAKEFKRSRPRDRFVHACVSDAQEPRAFRIYRDPLLSSLTELQAFDDVEKYSIDRVETVMPRGLDAILADMKCPFDFDLLSVDAEHHDLEVLRSIDFSRYRPEIVVAEARDTNAERLGDHEMSKHMAKNCYRIAGYQSCSLFFRRE